jgi:hypothetical protein
MLADTQSRPSRLRAEGIGYTDDCLLVRRIAEPEVVNHSQPNAHERDVRPMEAETISAIANVVTAAATLGAIGVASAGLNLWKQELFGQDEYTVAKELIRAASAANIYVHKLRVHYEYPQLISLDEIATKLSELTASLESCDCTCDAIFGTEIRLNGAKKLYGLLVKIQLEIRAGQMNEDKAEEYGGLVTIALNETVSQLRPYIKKHLSTV